MRIAVRRVVTASLVATIGCTSPAEVLLEDGPFITTDAQFYEASTVGWRYPQDRFWVVEFTVDLRYTNRADTPLYIAWDAPKLERYVDGRWETAYRPVSLLGGFRRLEPGDAFRREFRIRGHDPRLNVGPKWLTSQLAGLYRVVWAEVRIVPDVRSPAVPSEYLVSNIFEVAGELPT